MEFLTPIVLIVTVCCALIAATSDIIKSKIYNALTFPMAIFGLVHHATTSGVEGFVGSFLGMILGFAILVLPFAMGGMGGGDVKLLAGVGAWVGVPAVLYVFIIAGLMSGVCAIVMLLRQQRSLASIGGDFRTMWHQFTALRQETATVAWADRSVTQTAPRKSLIPFGVLLALAVVFTFLYANWRAA